MNKQQILIVSETSRENPQTVNALRGEQDWNVSPVPSMEEAIALFYAKPFDVIVIGKDIHATRPTDEQKLRAVLNRCSFESIILTQENDDAEELKSTIHRLINSRRAGTFNHIHVNDTLNVNNLADEIRIVPEK